MNKVILTGRLTKDVELKYTTNNKPVTQFSLAVYRDKEKTDFISIVAYNKTAELISKYCKKGMQVGIIGSLQTRHYTDKDGKEIYVTEVLCDLVEFLQNKVSKEEELQLPTPEEQDELPF